MSGFLTPTDIKNVREAFFKGTAGAMVGLGALGAVGVAREQLRKRELRTHEHNKEENFAKMIQKVPELAKHDPVRVREAYDIMADLAPGFARHPRVASDWIIAHENYGGAIPFNSLADLVKAEKTHSETPHGALRTNVNQAFISSALPRIG